MREILFRGIDDEEEFVVYGLLSLERDKRRGKPYLIKPCIVWEEAGLLYNSFIIPETVCQFTGLFDRNGNKIFEGDICRFYNGDGETFLYAVEWDELNCCFAIRY